MSETVAQAALRAYRGERDDSAVVNAVVLWIANSLSAAFDMNVVVNHSGVECRPIGTNKWRVRGAFPIGGGKTAAFDMETVSHRGGFMFKEPAPRFLTEGICSMCKKTQYFSWTEAEGLGKILAGDATCTLCLDQE